jgi:hypothetical protein
MQPDPGTRVPSQPEVAAVLGAGDLAFGIEADPGPGGRVADDVLAEAWGIS